MPENSQSLAGKSVLLGVTGGIACYKSAEILRELKTLGADVTVVMTSSAARFVTPLTFAALSGNPVLTGMFGEPASGAISHIDATRKADALVVAPATANILGKMAAGIADDLLSTMLVAARCPVIAAPAMNCRMFESPAVKRNIETLIKDGVIFVGPEEGPMACNEYGRGRMSEPETIVSELERVLAKRGALKGRRVLVTAGPTIEDIDPVRFIGNRSTGKMGYAVAAAARDMGADVTLVSGPTQLTAPAGVEVLRTRSAHDMQKAVMRISGGSDIVFMAAAVSDYAPQKTSDTKIKKTKETLTIKLVKTPDIIAGLSRKKRKGQVIIGFAAETDELDKNARKKLKEKGLDLIAANPVGGDTGFGSDYNILRIYSPKGLVVDTGRLTKPAAAAALLDCVLEQFGFLVENKSALS